MAQSEVRSRAAPPVRLTRRGRAVMLGLALLLAGLVVVAAVAVVGMVAPPASRAADPVPAGAGREPAVAVVRPGDTLWSVAARHAPSRDAPGTIEEIRRLNRLPDHTIHPGQRLILPSGR